MKTNFTGSALFTFLLFNTFVCVSQSPPPGISWKRSDRIQEYPPFVHVPVTQELKMASEDWWYDHKNSYENGIVDPAKFNGFITCGYSQYRNIEFEEQNGCEQQELGTVLTHCNDELDFTNFNPGRYNSHSFQTIARFDVFGNMLWYKTFNRSWFIRIIQSSDGNYIAVGPTISTEDLNKGAPIYYNPGQNGCCNAFGINGIPCMSFITQSGERKVNVVKIDPDGNVIWNYLYGVRDINQTDFEKDKHWAMDLVEFNTDERGPTIRIVGKVEQHNENFDKAFFIDINSMDGTFIQVYNSPSLSGGNKTWNAIERRFDSGVDYLAVVGVEEYAVNNKEINVNLFEESNTTAICENNYSIGSGTPNNNVTDLCFDSNGDLLIPVIYNCNSCNGAGDNEGEAAVFRIDPCNTTILDQYQISDGTSPGDLVHAYDLMIGITNTTDGGFAIVTSKVINEFNSVHPPPVSWYCNSTQYTSSMGELTYWNADAFVRKWDAAGNIEWTKDFDIDEKAPEAFPGDQKRQECMYSISETPDNGFVVSGNNSRNFDDCYLVKLYSNCNNEVVYDYQTESEDGILTITELGTNTLSGNYKIKGSIVVGNQEQLTISGTSTIIEFADTRQCGIPTNIIVEKGGLLTITDGAKLTAISDCELSMWDGIQLWGNSTAPQTGSDQPGVFIDAQSIIENARYGILADKADYVTHEKNIDDYQCKIKDLAMAETQSYGGGYVYCSDANFRNNRFSIVLNSYTQNNESVIMNSNFFLDEPIHDFDVVNEMGFRKGINSFIKLFDVFRNPGGLIITENNFDILSGILQSPDDYGKGISAFNSTFQASSNTFNNLNFGLISGAFNTLNTFSFKCNTLTNMIHGAHISGIDYFQMHTNDFQITNEAHPYGIYMENCTGYGLEQNTLSFNSSNWNRNPIGIINYVAVATLTKMKSKKIRFLILNMEW